MTTEVTTEGVAERVEVGAREGGSERLEGLLATGPLVQPLVGQGYLVWLHVASSFALVGASQQTSTALVHSPLIDLALVGPSRATGFDASPARSCPRAYAASKAVLDRTVALLALLLTAPLFLAVAAVVRTTSKGPVLFRQERLGRDGKRIKVLKFRTMVVDAEERLRRDGLWDRYVENGYKLPPDEDPRVTRPGRFLRKMSLDELPQLVNVLKGEMSLVGPRPIVPSELHCYGALAHCYLSVLPGITGQWQVTGRSTIAFPERALIDDEYFRTRCLRVDLVILARTPLVVLRGTGAY